MKEPELTVAGTSKEIVLTDILEFFHQLENDFDPSDLSRASDLIDVGKAFSAFKFLGKFLIGHDEGKKEELMSIIEGIDVVHKSKTGEDAVPLVSDKKSHINWCLSASAPLSNSVEEWSKTVLQNRIAKKKTKKSSIFQQHNYDPPNKKQKSCKNNGKEESTSVQCGILLADVTNK